LHEPHTQQLNSNNKEVLSSELFPGKLSQKHSVWSKVM